ncbi:hypothetical protein LY90DRAFT_698808 [Neocallimastix californiae]|uniref:Uncharacterized protein n=1 Tax=Neocallimastix californiae TaxID=1754190 RepID=A0A1Y2EY25_9FUNG|nr:hypothetical protein LY90DRAFT_698808 [Neocallimastix californiae]|eukprot:ORY76493.1 hypothetical protein LY90DRAFT_698808 [Neocallimastix californiae]
MFKNILKLFTLVAACSTVVNAAATLDYTKEGVLRKEDKCDINFVNFGIEADISGLKVKKENNSDGSFNLSIAELKNGNVGLRSNESGYTFDENKETKDYVKITQSGNDLKDFEVKPASKGKFSLVVKNLKSCDGLSIKQTFKDDALMNTYLYYSNVTPEDINHPFNIVEFGPSSNDVPYDTLSWNMNTGLDAVREKCRIFIDFRETNNVGGFHWVWYVSTDTINADKCDNPTFYNIAKKSYASMEVMDELFGDHYNGYVIKREGKENGHMDGILVDQKYLIEIYQNGCDEQNKDQVICTISSNKKLTYKEFTEEFVKNCSSVIENPEEEVKWSVDENGVTAKFDTYSLNITNYNRGALPKNENESVSYKEFKAANSSGIARFNVCTKCGDGSYIGEKCKCEPCPENCTKCTDGKTCTECATGSELVDGKCKIITTTTTTTTTAVEETETIGNTIVTVKTDNEEETEEVKDSEETSGINDSDVEPDDVSDAPTVVEDEKESEIEEVDAEAATNDEVSDEEGETEAIATAGDDDETDDEEEEEGETDHTSKKSTKIVVVKKPKTVKKCAVKEYL